MVGKAEALESGVQLSNPFTREELLKYLATAEWAFDNNRAATLTGSELYRLVLMAMKSL